MEIARLHRSRPAPPTLAAYAEGLDAERYSCPGDLSRWLDVLLDPAGSLRVLTVTGRGGIGKSAALREVARRAERSGRRAVTLDARVDDVLTALGRVEAPDTVAVLDEVDALGPALTAVAAAVAGLPQDARLVVAGRSLPARWLPEPLLPLAAHLRLAGLAPDEADALLGRYGVDDAAARAALAARAGGLPLALVLGARAWRASSGAGERDEAVLARESGEHLAAHLADAALDLLDPDLLAVLVLAAGVDLPLLSELFPERATALLQALRESSVVEPVGGRLVLHPSLAELLAERLWAEEPARAGAMLLRIAAHEHARAVAGEAGALPRLAALVRDPGLRSGMGPTTLTRYYADRWRPGDAVVVRDALEARHPGLWSVVAPWLGEGTRVVRRSGGRPVALVAALAMEAAGAVDVPRSRLVAPVVEHARRHGDAERAVLSAVQLTFGDADEPEVAWVRNAAGLGQCGVGNPRSDHVNLVGDLPEERTVLEAYGYAEVPDLRRDVDGVPVTTWVADVGPGGLAGLLHAAVVAENAPPAVAGGGVDLLAALETFPELSEQARAWVRSRVDAVLADEPVLRDLVARRYLTAGATHESVMRAAYLSRATYFRRLRRVRELVAGG